MLSISLILVSKQSYFRALYNKQQKIKAEQDKILMIISILRGACLHYTVGTFSLHRMEVPINKI